MLSHTKEDSKDSRVESLLHQAEKMNKIPQFHSISLDFKKAEMNNEFAKEKT